MKRHCLFIKSIFFIVLISGVFQPSYAKKLYKWTDKNGKTFFSDKVPPTQKHLKRERLNKIGEVIEEIKEVKKPEIKVKTKEVLLAEEKLEKLKQQEKKQQKVLQKKQKQQDKYLLSTFDTFELIEKSHEGRLNALDNKIKSLEDKRIQQQEKLDKHKQKASNNELNNRDVSKKEREAMSELEKEVDVIKLSIEKEIKIKEATEIKQETERKRYLFLMESRSKELEQIGN